jgi:hypothetical protein
VVRHVRGNAVGYVALFVALGGTGVAATRLPANSVGTGQLRNGAVTGQKVARHALTGANIKLSTLGAVPDAQRLGGRRPGSFQSRVSGSCVGNQAIARIAATGTVTCQPTGIGTITTVTAGTDLIGGGSSGDATLSVDETKLQHRLSGGCPAGQALQSIAQDGTPLCAAFGNGTISGVTAGTSLAGGGASGSVTMSVADGGIGTTQLADGAVTNGKLANSSLTVASGTGLTGGGSISLGGARTLGVDPTVVQDRVGGSCPDGSSISSINQDGTVSCAGVKVIAGFVGSDGSVLAGSGFTVSRDSTGRYRVIFPAGTWSGNLPSNIPVITVTPVGPSAIFVIGDSNGSDGSASFNLLASSTVGSLTPVDSGFMFIATQA